MSNAITASALLTCVLIGGGMIALNRQFAGHGGGGYVQGLLEPATLAMMAGLILGQLIPINSAWLKGARLASQRVLTIGIALVGARIDASMLLQLGTLGFVVSAFEVTLVIGLFALFGTRLGLSRSESLIIGAGCGICGGSAILAVAPLVRAKESEIICGISALNFLGIGAMLILPFFGHLAGMNEQSFGAWAGLTIHNIPQVVTTGFSWSPSAGETATLVKLGRVCMLVPAVLILGVLRERISDPDETGAPHPGVPRRPRVFLPGFIIAFAALALARSLDILPELHIRWEKDSWLSRHPLDVSLPALCAIVSGWFVTIGMAGVGLETRFRQFDRGSLRLLLGATLATVVIALLSYLTTIALF